MDLPAICISGLATTLIWKERKCCESKLVQHEQKKFRSAWLPQRDTLSRRTVDTSVFSPRFSRFLVSRAFSPSPCLEYSWQFAIWWQNLHHFWDIFISLTVRNRGSDKFTSLSPRVLHDQKIHHDQKIKFSILSSRMQHLWGKFCAEYMRTPYGWELDSYFVYHCFYLLCWSLVSVHFCLAM